MHKCNPYADFTIDFLRTKTILGTPDYLAHEILANEGYNRSVDTWALGIFLYELLIGDTPYFSNDINKLYHIITNERLDINIDDDAKNLISLLLYINPKQRYGYDDEGITELKRHNFFYNFNWEKWKKKN